MRGPESQYADLLSFSEICQEAAIKAQNDAKKFGIDPDTIAPYRSGYDAELRREIEEGLRNGRYKAVFSTNALEIGVDIGRLDVCILAGFPDSVFSAWQRIGRVGRTWNKKAYVLFYAFNNPFDQFFASNIDAFLEKPLDEILIGVDNEELIDRHIPYLVHECGGACTPRLAQHLGSPFFDILQKKMEGKKPVRTHKPNYQGLSIRGGSGATYRLVYRDKDKDFGTISEEHRFREAYIGAVYNHFGKQYRVIAHAADEVQLADADPHLRTEGIFWSVIHSVEILKGIRYAEKLAGYYGRLTVYENFGGYRLIDTSSGETVEEQRNQSARQLKVRGFWLELTDASILGEGLEVKHLFGFEQLLRIGSPFIVPCDRHDLATLTNPKHPATVYLYETVQGGIGVAEKVLAVWPEVVKMGIGITERCPCKNGCPSCLVPPRWPSNVNDLPDKVQTVRLARQFLEIAASADREAFDPTTHAWVPCSQNRRAC